MSTNPPKPKKARTFRKQGKQWFLTYSQCLVEPQECLDQLNDLLKENIENYIIAQEEHKDEGKHLHVYLKLDKIKDVINPRYYDLEKETIIYHGNYQTCRSPKRVMEYVTKDGNYITNMNLDKLLNTKVYDNVVQLAEEGKLSEAYKALPNRDKVLHGSQVRINLEQMTTEIIPINEEYTFHPIPGIDRWNRTHFAAWINGETNTGKTEYAKTLFKNPHLISHIDQLKQFKAGIHDGIIFDDMSFKHWPRQAQIHILDIENPRGINVKHSVVTIPAGTPRIFTSNDIIFDIHDTAIKRRISYFKVPHDLRIITNTETVPINEFEWNENTNVNLNENRQLSDSVPRDFIINTDFIFQD